MTADASKYVAGGEPCGEDHDRPRPGGERAERDERVHRRRAVARVQQRSAVELEAAPEHGGRRERERDPFPAGEADRGSHREHDERDREPDRDEQARGRRAVLVDVCARARRLGVVADALDGADERIGRDEPRVVVHGRGLGGEVDGRLDAVELVEAALDPRGAGRARHAGERERLLFDRGHYGATS